MFRIFHLFAIILYSTFSVGAMAQNTLVINEVLTENHNSIRDFEGERNAWIELYNPGAFAVNLQGYYLSNRADDLYRWEISRNLYVAAGGFTVIFLSAKDTAVGQELHTNFKLNHSGDVLFLSNPRQETIDQVVLSELPSNVAYARFPDGGDTFYYTPKPTPRAANQKGSTELLAPPILGKSSGYYSGNEQLSMHCPDTEAAVIYTTTGAIPQAENSQKYEAPLLFSTLSTPDSIAYIKTSKWWTPPPEPPYTATTIAARCAKNGSISPETTHGVYWIDREKHQLPVFHLHATKEDFFGDLGIMVPGPRIQYPEDGWIDGGNYQMRGREWERPAFLTFLDTFGQPMVAQNVGVRIHGGATRRYPKKSLRLYSGQSRDAVQNRFDYPFFQDNSISTFRRLLLRQSGNDWGGPNHFWRPERGTLFRDVMMQSLLTGFSLETQSSLPAVLYLNGVYWGIYNLRERYDYHYFDQYYGIAETDLDLLSHTHMPVLSEAATGDNQHYMAMIDTLMAHDSIDKKTIDGLIDVQNLMDYYTANIYFGNTDWPANNVRMWRFRQENFRASGELHPKDGRWRWALFDTDFGFGFVGGSDNDLFSFALSEGKIPFNLPIIKTLEIPEYRESFIVRFTDYLNHHFRPYRVKNHIEHFEEQYAPEIMENVRRWDAPASLDDWHNSVNILKVFAQERPYHVRRHLQSFFDLGKMHEIILHVNELSAGGIQINELPRADYRYPWNGIYFEDFRIRLIAHPFNQHEFSHWEDEDGNQIGQTDTLWINLQSETFVKAVFRNKPENGENTWEWADAHPLAQGPYLFSAWAATAEAGSNPPSMDLLQLPAELDFSDIAEAKPWALGFDHQEGSRFEGLGEQGLGIQTTANRLPLEESGYPAAVCLSINTQNVANAALSVDLRTLALNDGNQAYLWSYRIGTSGKFLPLPEEGIRALRFLPTAPHHQIKLQRMLPSFLMGHERVQIALHWENQNAGIRQNSPLMALEKWKVEAKDFQSIGPEQEEEETIFRLYPNPNNGYFRISRQKATGPKPESVLLYDLKGRLLAEKQTYFHNKNSNLLNFSHLKPGLYLLQLKREDQVQEVLKLIIAKD